MLESQSASPPQNVRITASSCTVLGFKTWTTVARISGFPNFRMGEPRLLHLEPPLIYHDSPCSTFKCFLPALPMIQSHCSACSAFQNAKKDSGGEAIALSREQSYRKPPGSPGFHPQIGFPWDAEYRRVYIKDVHKIALWEFEVGIENSP